ncbi:50S ribosomal protein L11 methyltransferase [Candidatus Poribacteria bacterium]|nr:50S ribosomal protein L11 methyltransferase [Candidatus Poribacteria bacterium]
MKKPESKRPEKIWHKVTVSVAKGDAEKRGTDPERTGLSPMDAFVDAVQSLRCCGIESKDEGGEREQVDAYFEDAIDPADLQAHMELIAELISAAGGSAAGGRKLKVGDIKEVPEEDWAEEWRRNWKPVRVTRRVLICPSWIETPKKPGQIVIYIYPRMAFGTGSHATTQICLKLLELHMRQGSRVIDIGAGSAILSIGAAKLGARSVVAVEMDEVATENATENCKFNRVLTKVRIMCNRFGPSIRGRFDLGVCNMLGHEMLPLLPDITRLLAGKALIASGLTRESVIPVRREMARLGWRLDKTLKNGEWVGFYATHKRK